MQDELNCLTGELTQRIGEAILNGSEEWYIAHTKDTTLTFKLTNHKIKSDGFKFNSLTKHMMICNNLKNNGNVYSSDNDGEGYQFDGGMILYVGIEKNKLASGTSVDFKQWLKSNPIVFQYVLPTESVKTVDLTVVDQDGNETKLRTFDDTTHVLLNSEGLIPTAALTVRTKIPSGSSTSLLMDDISTEQQQLETTVDEQSNNVDATMIATTEIFEETL